MAERYSITHLYRSSVSGRLVCFHVLALMKGAAVNIGMHVSFPIIVLSRYRPRSEIAGLYVNQGFLCSFKKLTYLTESGFSGSTGDRCSTRTPYLWLGSLVALLHVGS